MYVKFAGMAGATPIRPTRLRTGLAPGRTCKSGLGLPEGEQTPPVAPATIALRPSRVPEAALAALRQALGEAGVSTADRVRLPYSLGKRYRYAIALRSGQVPNPTDVVVFPAGEEAVQRVLALAAAHGLAVVPFGGGTSVVGGVEPRGPKPTLTLSLARLNQVPRVDTVSHTVTAQAEVLGARPGTRVQRARLDRGPFAPVF